MLDAVGQTIDLVKSDVPGTRYLMLIISDGEENASVVYSVSGYQRIAEKIQHLKTSGWTFTYMGANQDLSVVSANLGLDLGNMASYTNTVTGTARACAVMASSISNYRASAINDGVTQTFYSTSIPLDLTGEDGGTIAGS